MAVPTLLLLMATMMAADWGRVAGECNKPPALENGMLEDKYISMSTFESGSKVRYRCVPGFVLASGNSPFILCNGDVWGPLKAVCQIKSCGSPGDILNGGSTSTSNTFGSTVTFFCDSGYNMVGRATRQCEVDGWSGQVPTCEAVKCPDLPAIENGNSPRPNGEDFWGYGMVAEYSCNNDYSLIGLRTITCEATGQWSGVAPSCKVVRCLNPKIPEHGRMVGGFADVYVYGHEITFRCDEGYKMIGEGVIKCNENNEFAPSPPTCQLVKSCGSPGEILNGGSTSTGNTIGSTVTFSCDSGYRMEGRATRQCEDAGWSGQVPTCEVVKCLNPKIPEHGRMIGGFADVYVYGHEITFRCDEGYKMIGEDVIKCRENNEFVPSPPTCQPDSGMSAGQKAGIIVGVIILCIVLIAAIVVIIRSCKRKQMNPNCDPDSGQAASGQMKPLTS